MRSITKNKTGRLDTINRLVVKGHSIKVRVAFALFVLVAIQGLILLCSIAVTGALGKNDTATYNVLANQSVSMGNELQNIFNTKRKNITNASMEFSRELEELLTKNNISPEALDSAKDVYDNVQDTAIAHLVAFTKYTPVTGAFIVLDTAPDVAGESVTSRKSVYIRDSSPGIISGNNSNLLLEYGHVDTARNIGIGVDFLWTRDMDFSDGYYRDFYFKPVNAALSHGASHMLPQDYGYWSPPFKIRKNDVSVITYSLPLILSDGSVCGVIGFELSTNYVSNLLKAAEIPFDNGLYLLGVDVGDGLYNDEMIFSGAYANQFLSGSRAALAGNVIYESGKNPVHEVYNPNMPAKKTIGAYAEIKLYETFSPFYNEKWTLICMAPKDTVMSGSWNIRNSIFISIFSTVCLALILAIFVTLYITAPINLLSQNVRRIDPEKLVRFERTNIREIDALEGALETLSDDVYEAAGKMFKIVELVDMPLGSFEVNHKDGTVRLSESLYRLLNLEPPADGSFRVSSSLWDGIIKSLNQEYSSTDEDGITESLLLSGNPWDTKTWFRMRVMSENTRDIGVIIDVTDEITQKQRLEFERNYDSLTKLLGRQAFVNKSRELVKSMPNKSGVMLFADIDDLKFINDMYGHETGDAYIKRFAGLLNKFSEKGAVIGRISGDEFAMFMSGFSSNIAARTTFDNVLSGLRDMVMTLPDGLNHKLRASIGLSYYPEDSDDIEELIKYADYAMYEVKHSSKGDVKEFNIGDYNKNSAVTKMRDTLNILINGKRVGFAFQPIVDVRTGEIYAYEALMRSMMREFNSPLEILNTARSNSCLYQIEYLAFDLVLSWIGGNVSQINEKKIFINSIPGQIFTEDTMSEITNKYGHLSDMLVVELSESEFSGFESAGKKADMFRQFGVAIAIDGYGAGYSNKLAFLQVSPEYLKIDISIVRDIDKDKNKQQLVQNVIASISKKKIKVIAEGVETYEEMKILVGFGVDYIQGYYLAKPGFELSDIPAEIKNELVEASRGRREKA